MAEDEWTLGVLGPLEARHNGVLVPVAAAKQRVLLAVLALAAGEPVTVERLIACLWGERPPASARNTLQNYVLRLRRILQTDTAPCPVVTSTAGYHLDVSTDAIDVHRFGALVRRAQSVQAAEADSASALLDQALALWRGQPLADVPSEPLLRDVVPGLVEQRLAARELRIDLDLRRGLHGKLVTELVELTTAHPLRERLWAQLMLALYRCGRAADALDAYRQARTVLADELGIDPGPRLQQLHQAVLTNDPDLISGGSAPEAAVPAPVATVVPRQLPALTGHFVGRTSEQRHLSAHLAAAGSAPLTVISAIGGTAGIGKTALAVHWGHQHADRFPDGQLYVNLRGFDPGGDPLPSSVAVRRFLTVLGVPDNHIPTGPDEQAALYRSHMAGRRMLVVLDNARDADQVRPLLPAAPGCVVLVTSRDRLAGLVALDGAVPLTLGLLTCDEARDLLVHRLGLDRVQCAGAVVDDLIEACARLPLALNIAAAHAALHPTHPLSTLAEQLRDARGRLDMLSTGEAVADVRAVFSWSYDTLAPEPARVFRLLGLHSGPDISLPAAAGLTGLDLDTTRYVLDELARAHLVTEPAPGRYTQHDLLRAYAADKARTDDSETERRDALRRMVDFYLHTASAADLLLQPHRPPSQFDPPLPGTRPHPLPDIPAALAWLDLEHANLLAAQRTAASHTWHAVVWQLAWGLTTFHDRQGHLHDRLTVWQAALDAAAHLPSRAARFDAHRNLGYAYIDLGRHDAAIGHLHRALALAEEHQDAEQRARMHQALACAWQQRGDARQALRHATRAHDLFRVVGDAVREADTLNLIGWNAAQLGEYDTARARCQAAAIRHRRVHNPVGEALALDSLGYIAHHTGDHHEAIDHYQQTIALYRESGDSYYTADTLERLGHPYLALGEPEQARTAWQEALRLFGQQGRDEDAARVQRQLDTRLQ